MQRVGDMPEMKKLVKLARANVVTAAKHKLLDAAVNIRQNPNDAEAAYMARQLVQCTLPHRNPGNDKPAWMRANGELTLGIKPGSDLAGKTYGYPYGSIPRLLLFWMTTEAVKTKNRRLELGHNLSDFMHAVGLNSDTGRGNRGDAKRLRNQMERLFRSTISFEVTRKDGNVHGKGWLDMQVAPEGEFWWDPKQPEQSVFWESWIELGEKFFQAITAAPVPVDTRALKALKRSPLALDLYALSVHKAFTSNKTGSGQYIPWAGLLRQLGADYAAKRIDNFKGKVKTTLRNVAAVFPEGLQYEWHRTGLAFLPGTKLAIAPAPKKGLQRSNDATCENHGGAFRQRQPQQGPVESLQASANGGNSCFETSAGLTPMNINGTSPNVRTALQRIDTFTGETVNGLSGEEQREYSGRLGKWAAAAHHLFTVRRESVSDTLIALDLLARHSDPDQSTDERRHEIEKAVVYEILRETQRSQSNNSCQRD